MKPASTSHSIGLAAPVPERHPADGAGRQDHPAAAGDQVLGDLAARLGAADDQHRPAGELAGAAVAGGVDWATLAGSRRASAGTRGWFWSPVATTTARATRSPPPVRRA